MPSAASTISFDYAYNSANQRTQVTQGDGSYWIYAYDPLGQVTSGIKHFSDGRPVPGEQFGYDFDEIGNRISTAAGGDQYGVNLRYANYSANALNQYTSRTVPGAVDIVGSAANNSTVTVNNQPTYRHNDFYQTELALPKTGDAVYQSVTNLSVLNRGGTTPDLVSNITGNVFLPQTPEHFTYDVDGNMTSDGRWTNSWAAENRLTSMTSLSTGPSASRLQLQFVYDHQSRRMQKLVSTWNGSSYTPSYTNRFVYDGWNVEAEINPTNALIRGYLWGLDLSRTMQTAGGVGGLIATVNATTSAATNYFACYDGNGNITGHISGSDGTVFVQYEYGPFGEIIRATGPMAKANPLRFSTKYQDDETDLLYYGHRYYSASTGRWLSKDPLGDEAFFRSYSADKDEIAQMLLRVESLKPSYVFALNQPISAIDLLGLDRWEINWIHSWVVVEVRNKCCSKVIGYKRIEFSPRGEWGGEIIIETAGFVAPGEVSINYVTKPSGWAPNYIPSSCAADKFLLEWAEAMAADPPLYSFWAFNGRHFAAIAQMMGIEETAP